MPSYKEIRFYTYIVTYGTKTVMKRAAQIGWGPYTPDKSLDFQVQLV